MEDELRGYLEAMEGRLLARMNANHETVLNALTAIRDDIGVNMGSTERVREANDHTRDELRSLGETVSVIFRRLRQVEEKVRELRGEP